MPLADMVCIGHRFVNSNTQRIKKVKRDNNLSEGPIMGIWELYRRHGDTLLFERREAVVLLAPGHPQKG
jgi:hypothetical protein